MMFVYLCRVKLLFLKGKNSSLCLTSFLKVLTKFYSVRWLICVLRALLGKCGIWFRFVLPLNLQNLVFVSLCSELQVYISLTPQLYQQLSQFIWLNTFAGLSTPLLLTDQKAHERTWAGRSLLLCPFPYVRGVLQFCCHPAFSPSLWS